MKGFIFFAAFLLSISAFAGWKEDFEILKHIPRDYQDAGSICEEVARVDMMRLYRAPQYTVEVGIAYADDERTIGELDIVIFDNNMNKVIKVGEVKCWKDVRGGLKKAREQRTRFINNLESGRVLRFRSTSTGKYYDPGQFTGLKDFFSMAQKGSAAQGFTRELQYTLSELKQYRKEMIHCQNRGECVSPYNRGRNKDKNKDYNEQEASGF